VNNTRQNPGKGMASAMPLRPYTDQGGAMPLKT